MLHKTKGVVLHIIKYNDTSVICHVYTEKFGRKAFIFKGMHSKHNKQRSAIQPLSLLELIVYHRINREIQTVNEFRAYPIYNTIPFNVHKSTIALFLTEVLRKILVEEVSNNEMYDFIEKALLYFDKNDKNITCFHLLFLVQLTRFLGFFPQNNYSPKYPYFDLSKGFFTPVINRNHGLDLQQSKYISTLLGTSIFDLPHLRINLPKHIILKTILKFYKIHIENIGHLKSLEVLRSVYH